MKAIYVGKSGDRWLVIRLDGENAQTRSSHWSKEGAERAALSYASLLSSQPFNAVVQAHGARLPRIINDAGQQRTLDEPVAEAWIYG